ncbi:hypothetical protein F4780DRAFT_233620 [Xylariomycetidae sp. FL0641]|nr:hypothetical protein F4780DRAFT_233620 [Xylariomycetidae sp. FL0641]
MSRPNWQMGTSYADERRAPTVSSDSYRPSGERRRDDNRSQARFRDSRDTRRSPPRDPRLNSPTNLRVDTRVGPADGMGSMSSNESPANSRVPSGARASPATLSFVESASGKNTFTNASLPRTPKPRRKAPRAKNPQLQNAVESLFDFTETWQERMELRSQRDSYNDQNMKLKGPAALIGRKSSQFGPYQGLEGRFQQHEHHLNLEIKEIDAKYFQELEQVVSALSSKVAAPSQPTLTSGHASISALEKKFEEFEKKAQCQQDQILELLDARKRSSQELETLQSEFKGLQSQHETMRGENADLKGQIETLQRGQGDIDLVRSKLEEVDTKVDKAITEAELEQLRSQCSQLSIAVESQDRYSRELKVGLDRLRGEQESSRTAIKNLGDKIESEVEGLDTESWDNIASFWADFNAEKKLRAHESFVKKLQEGPTSFETVTQDLKQGIDLLRQAQDTANKPTHQPSQTMPPNNDFELIVKKVTEMVDPKIDNMNAKVSDTVNKIGDLMFGEIARLDANITASQGKPVTTSEYALASIEARIEEMETIEQKTLKELGLFKETVRDIAQWKGLSEPKLNPQSPQYLLRYHGELSHRLSRLEHDVKELASSTTGNATNTELKEKVDMLEMSVKTLNDQWSNVNSKHMAERIFHLASQFFLSRLEQVETAVQDLRNRPQDTGQNHNRAHDMELKITMQQLRNKIQDVEGRISKISPNLTQLEDIVAALTNPSDTRRIGSPLIRPGELSKKRKIQDEDGSQRLSLSLQNGSNGYPRQPST